MTVRPSLKKLGCILGLSILAASVNTANAQPTSVNIHVGVRPPAARVERIPGPRAGHVWASG